MRRRRNFDQESRNAFRRLAAERQRELKKAATLPRGEIKAVIIEELSKKRSSIDYIAEVAGVTRTWVLALSRQNFSWQEHEENIRRGTEKEAPPGWVGPYKPPTG
jgi:hypothetical protein